MDATKWLKPSDSVSRIGEPRLPLWVTNGSPAWTTECPELGVEQTSFDIFISVVEDKIQGKAVFPEKTYEIVGDISKDGVFVGQVESFSIAFAELKGDMGPSSGHGQWRTFKGPKCAGTFEVTKL